MDFIENASFLNPGISVGHFYLFLSKRYSVNTGQVDARVVVGRTQTFLSCPFYRYSQLSMNSNHAKLSDYIICQHQPPTEVTLSLWVKVNDKINVMLASLSCLLTVIRNKVTL